jgi:peptide/nickel transport system ATP-binding protein
MKSTALAAEGHSSSKTRRARVIELLRAVGLDESILCRFPHEFSGGQRQRIGIARALALHPKFIVADEPVSALDVSVGAQIVNLLAQLQRDFGLTYLFISHSMPVVRYLSTRIAVMYRGKIVEIGSTDQITDRPQHPYTRSLLEATPEVAV